MSARVPTHEQVVDFLGNAAQAFTWWAELARTSAVPTDYLAVAAQVHRHAAGLCAELGALLGAAERFPVPATSLTKALDYARQERS